MTQTMVNIHQNIIEQASNPKNPNLVSGDNRQIPSVPPSLDKEKLSVMQAQVLQGQKQISTSPPHNTEIIKARVPAGPVKKQVVEAWNHQNNKRSHGAPKLRMNEQHEHTKTAGACQCCEYYGHSCLQEEASLMIPEARQRYHLDINEKRKLCTQNPVLEEVAQAVDSNQIINLEDWSITFKAFQPDRIKQLKKHASEESQDKSIKRLCFKCGEEGHYVNNCPTKRKRILLSHDGSYCLKCGENGHLASWCAKEDDNQPQDRSLNTFTSSQTCNRQDTKARKACFYCNKEGHFIS
jgi:hypothetical protein